jgi:uncharacterized protein involved in response to NO
MAGTAAQGRAWRGPAVFSYGFRPFFLLAGLWAAGAMLGWAGWLAGVVSLGGPFSPLEWHVHALLFGYVPAVVAGFLLTAVPNWTGRLPVVGWPLALLAGVWMAGRVTTTVPLGLPAWAVALADLAFLAAFAGLIAREIVAGRNWRNLKVLVPLVLLASAQAIFHVEAAAGGMAAQGMGMRAGLAATIFLILLIGGRIVPSFTRNWLARQQPGPLPAGISAIDAVGLSVAGAALAFWVALPVEVVTGVLALAAGVLNLARLARWQGWRTGAEPLVTILHLAWAFAPLGLLLLGAGLLAPTLVPMAVVLHCWTVGAIAGMTLAVMTRATLGHSGQALQAGGWTVAIYVLIIGSALTRMAAAYVPDPWVMQASALAWVAAFAVFSLRYGPLLLGPRARPAG